MDIESRLNIIKMVKIRVSFVVSLTTLVFAISCNLNAQTDTRRFDTAFIQTMSNPDSASIKLYCRAKLMVHDMVSLLKPHFYIDSTYFMIPSRHEEFIKFDKIETFYRPHYPFAKGGITFSSDSVKIDLYYYDYDDKETYTVRWNGTYLLKWIK